MSRETTRVFECEIRDTQSHFSTDDPSADAQFTVVADTLHPGDRFDTFDEITAYIEDDHDQSFDVVIHSTAADDTDFSGEVTEATTTVGGATAKHTIAGPLGRVRLEYQAGALASAPTAGSCRVTFHALGRE